MKNLKLLLALAVVLGAGSAFSTAEKAQEEFIQVEPGNIVPENEAGPGHCENGGPGCRYVSNGSGGYTNIDGASLKLWVPQQN